MSYNQINTVTRFYYIVTVNDVVLHSSQNSPTPTLSVLKDNLEVALLDSDYEQDLIICGALINPDGTGNQEVVTGNVPPLSELQFPLILSESLNILDLEQPITARRHKRHVALILESANPLRLNLINAIKNAFVKTNPNVADAESITVNLGNVIIDRFIIKNYYDSVGVSGFYFNPAILYAFVLALKKNSF